ncbi:hypothetical protein INT80_06380 [Gallibacterium anatis]|uniref:Uncharacterized protein n=1 Tax=Gallibacterium anatis TaxID=750 RepID=A0A930URC1_9PAST|nr:hypothetical protein [Gallibacterium anatis]
MADYKERASQRRELNACKKEKTYNWITNFRKFIKWICFLIFNSHSSNSPDKVHTKPSTLAGENAHFSTDRIKFISDFGRQLH